MNTPLSDASERVVEAIFSTNKLADIKVTYPAHKNAVQRDACTGPAAVKAGGRSLNMVGLAGLERELAFLPSFFVSEKAGQDANNSDAAFNPARHLPVLLGSGLGPALERIVAVLSAACGTDFHLAVVDKELDILSLTGLRERFSAYPGIFWIAEADAQNALNTLSKWQSSLGGRPFFSLSNPFYLRLDRPYYATLAESARVSAGADFWSKVAYAKFTQEKPRILLLTCQYFLLGEVQAACERLGLECFMLTVPDGAQGQVEFVEQLLSAVLSFKPDFALTINHLGVDREGVLADLLARLRLPLASWFVDNPHLILHLYKQVVSPWTAVFTWDADNLTSLRELGFEHVSHLPLGTDHTRFKPVADRSGFVAREDWRAAVSFVGNSMVHKVDRRLNHMPLPPTLKRDYQKLAAEFGASAERSVREWLRLTYPELFASFISMASVEGQLAYETALTWEATLQYRLSCVRAILPFNPLIVGDKGWITLLKDVAVPWSYLAELSYYTDLPDFYPLSAVNFNCTSKQMKGAVNQRVFDVPAAGAFLLTDWREQLGELFEPGKEVICYHSPQEAEDLVRYYLKHPADRQKIAAAGRKRVLREHTYDHRLRRIIAYMRRAFG